MDTLKFSYDQIFTQSIESKDAQKFRYYLDTHGNYIRGRCTDRNSCNALIRIYTKKLIANDLEKFKFKGQYTIKDKNN